MNRLHCARPSLHQAGSLGCVRPAMRTGLLVLSLLLCLGEGMHAQSRVDLRWRATDVRSTSYLRRSSGSLSGPQCELMNPADTTFFVGDTLTFIQLYENAGPDTLWTDSIAVEMVLDGRAPIHWSHREKGSLPPNQFQGKPGSPDRGDWIPESPGRYRYRLVLDAGNVVKETDERNNVFDCEIVIDERR